MTSEERRHYMRLLQQAKRGDEGACGQLAKGLAERFSYMIRGWNSVDPAIGREDLMLEFQLGIWQAIPKVDGRGDPLFHLAWRGQNEVRSLLNVVKHRRHGSKALVRKVGQEISVGTLPEHWDPPDQRPDSLPEYELMRSESERESRELAAYLMRGPDLSPRQRRLIEAMSVAVVRGEDGLNLRLAQILEVTEQATNVLHTRVLEKLGVIREKETLPCPHCGRGFGSKGALTQHRNGQSGHRPCEPD